jgi:hypothetical protein|tara:strand:- start:378 stop:785 length:408 start_codon:yes stop_codon:yes gene_type:complete
MATLEEDMLAQAAPQQMQAPAQSMTPTADAIKPMTEGDPLGDFTQSLIGLIESKGLDIDEVMNGQDSPEDQADLASDADPLELLSEEEIMMMTSKFLALSPEQQAMMERELSQVLPPKTINRLKAALRFSQQRGV